MCLVFNLFAETLGVRAIAQQFEHRYYMWEYLVQSPELHGLSPQQRNMCCPGYY